MDAVLSVTLLGSLSARAADSPDSSPHTHFRTQKTAALFAFLAFHAPIPLSRESLIARFWPDADLDAGRMSLRTALAALRRDFGDALVADKATVMLRAYTDLQKVERALRLAKAAGVSETQRIGHLADAVAAYGGPLLPGVYDDWALRERDRLAAAHLAALTALSRWHDTLGETPLAIEFAHRAAAADPLSEEIRTALIALLKKAGRLTEARRQFDDLERLVDEQLGARVSPALRALAASLPEIEPDESSAAAATLLLPVSRGRFRGRRDELSALAQRILGGKNDREGTRLFTLFGPGGVGKTRLAIETARRLGVHRFFATIAFAPLASASDHRQLWTGLRDALGLPAEPKTPPSEQVIALLNAEGPALVILDNLEQALPDAGAVVETLLEKVPKVTLLCTSRHRLSIAGEELIAIEGLTPDDAVALFVDRAKSAAPSFALTPDNEADLRALCAQLERFPLALELAAAWAPALSVAEMRRQIEGHALNLPARAVGETRHRSLSAAIAWSLDLLEPALKSAFVALCVFAGGFDADAAEAVSGAGRFALASLRDRSLIRSEPIAAQTPRFSLHHALIDFGEQNQPMPQLRALRRRHADFFARRIDGAQEGMIGPDASGWLGRITVDLDNLRAALAHGLHDSDALMSGLTVASELGRYWSQQGLLDEEQDWVLRYLSRVEGDTRLPIVDLRAKLAISAGRSYDLRGDFQSAVSYLEIADNDCRTVGDDAGLAVIALQRANMAWRGGQLHEALRRYDDCIAYWRTHLDPDGKPASQLSRALMHRSRVVATLGDREDAERTLREAQGIFQLRGDVHGLLMARGNRAVLAEENDDFALAQTLYEETLVQARALGIHQITHVVLVNLGRLAAKHGDPELARALLLEALPFFVRQRLVAEAALIALHLAEIAANDTNADRAENGARLLGLSQHLREQTAISNDISEAHVAQITEQLTQKLGETRLATLVDEGCAQELEDIFALASS